MRLRGRRLVADARGEANTLPERFLRRRTRTGARRRRRHKLRASGQESPIWLMEDQFVHVPIRAEIEFHSEALELVDDEGSALIGIEPVGWLAPECQRELPVAV